MMEILSRLIIMKDKNNNEKSFNHYLCSINHTDVWTNSLSIYSFKIMINR